MRTYSFPLLFALLLLCHAPALAADPHCAAREKALEQKLSRAEKAGNARQASGIREALAQIRGHCTDDGLRAEADKKLRQAEKEVAERENDLQKARAASDAKKIAKREVKLREAREEEREARQEREALR